MIPKPRALKKNILNICKGDAQIVTLDIKNLQNRIYITNLRLNKDALERLIKRQYAAP
jgi:hypothetical protein